MIIKPISQDYIDIKLHLRLQVSCNRVLEFYPVIKSNERSEDSYITLADFFSEKV